MVLFGVMITVPCPIGPWLVLQTGVGERDLTNHGQ
jgi:hypothetical protein